ncbi:hypothetical protein Mal64_38280 [Pseudobythopirellula maris]|uniref:DUF1573 domain-containing protein n=1 Tax=Pseudobythopirellula maris TaxID=2527991 RepID=A0A5C5ZGK9_9BACT|nr:DUF1573 domain-containing protein [Pseudobythopirellula maris]TWT86288.1 hypothetical protein Mal64_38280 [Pseudobythopirellula maris]
MKVFPLFIVSALAGVVAGAALGYSRAAPQAHEAADSSAHVSSSSPAAASLPPDETPRVEVDQANYNFGKMQRGSTESHEFVFTNSGTAPLYLEVGRTSCKCTLGNVSNEPLAPGDSTPVRLEWTALTQGGDFRQTAAVRTNDPKRPRVDLAVEGSVIETVGLTPRDFMLNTLAAGEEKSASVRFVSFEEDEFELTATMAPTSRNPDRFELDVVALGDDELSDEGAKSGYRIDLRALEGLPLGRINDLVELKTSLPTKPNLFVPVMGVVEGDISVHGRGWVESLGVLRLGAVESDEGATAKLLLSVKGVFSDETEFTLLEVDPEDGLRIELGEPSSPRDGVRHVPLTITLPPGLPIMIRNDTAQGQGIGLIRLGTTHPKVPTIDIGLQFSVY